MHKLVVFTCMLACAAAAPGYLGAPVADPWAHSVLSAPLVSPVAPAVVKTAYPVATSYANSVRFASPAVVAAPHYASPYAASYAAPAVVASPYAHPW